MSPPQANDLHSICEEFRAAWKPGSSASIASFLDRVHPDQSRQVLLALVDLDLQLRSDNGQDVNATIYAYEHWYPQYSHEVVERIEGVLASKQLFATMDPYATGEIRPASSSASTIGNYALIRRLGVGGMGEVYLAHHNRFHDRQYAIKVIRREYASARAIDRFEREIDAMGHLSHPNLVFAADAGRWHEQLYLVMEYVAGMDLQEVIDQAGPLPVSEACEVIRQAACGIAHAHKAGIIHRDIKPSNLMLSSCGEVKVLDLGLASLERAADNLTGQGAAIGTGAYMPPEQWRDSHSVGKPSDLYSLGCTFYGLLAGKPPFNWDGENSLPALMSRHVNDAPVCIQQRRPEVPDALSELILRTLQKDPDARVLVGEFAAQLGRFCDGGLSASMSIVNDHLRKESTADQNLVSIPDGLQAKPTAQPIRVTIEHRDGETFISQLDKNDSQPSGLRWSRNEDDRVSMKRLWITVGTLLFFGTISLVMAYYGPGRTETWIQRFDRLNMSKVPAGTGFVIELVRLFLFVGLTCFIVGSRFPRSLREFFNLKKWNLKTVASRAVAFVLVSFFVVAESRRHLSLESAPTDMVQWGAEHGILTTANLEAVPYAWYLPYSLISYVVVLGGLFAFPFIRFWLSDFSYMQRQADRFREIQTNVSTAELALRNLQRFAHECHSLTKRYIDILGVLCVGIQYEYWVGQLTLTGAGIQTAVMGWFAVAFAFAFVIAISATYVRGYNVTEEVVANHGSIDDNTQIGKISVGWFLKKAVFAQLGGILVLSLALVGIHAMLSAK